MANESLFKAKILTAEQADIEGFERMHIDVGDLTLNFSTFVRKRSIFLRRSEISSISRAGFATLASIYVPENSNKFTTSVQVFAFESPIEAQPCADQALLSRGYAPIPQTDQRGLFFGGSIGILYRDGVKISAAQAYCVVRGNLVLTIVMEFSIVGSDDALLEAGVFVSNMMFDNGEAPGFETGEIRDVAIPIGASTLHLSYPSNWTITGNGFAQINPPETVLFAVGDRNSPNGLMTFGFRRDKDVISEVTLQNWSDRIASQYLAENPGSLADLTLTHKSDLRPLRDTPINGSYFFYNVNNLKFGRLNQIRVIVIADGERRFTVSLLTDAGGFDEFPYFLIFATGVTANDLLVDSLLRFLIGKGI